MNETIRHGKTKPMVIGFVTCLCVLIFAVKGHKCTPKIFQMFRVIRNVKLPQAQKFHDFCMKFYMRMCIAATYK